MLPSTEYAQTQVLSACWVRYSLQRPFTVTGPEGQVGNCSDPNLHTRWPVDVALATGPRPWLMDDGSRIEPLAEPGDCCEAWPRSGRQAAEASLLHVRQGRPMSSPPDSNLELFGLCHRCQGEPRGSLLNIIF